MWIKRNCYPFYSSGEKVINQSQNLNLKELNKKISICQEKAQVKHICSKYTNETSLATFILCTMNFELILHWSDFSWTIETSVFILTFDQLIIKEYNTGLCVAVLNPMKNKGNAVLSLTQKSCFKVHSWFIYRTKMVEAIAFPASDY